MTQPISTHRKVITAIHSNSKWFDGEPFAIHEVIRASGVSRTSVKRCMVTLIEARLVLRRKRAFASRYYCVTHDWPMNLEDAIEAFEFARMMQV